MAAAGWTPTVDSYLGRVTKARILQAVREARGEPRPSASRTLKKGEMAEQAQALLAGSGWLPEPLRTPGQAVTHRGRCRTCEPREADRSAQRCRRREQPARRTEHCRRSCGQLAAESMPLSSSLVPGLAARSTTRSHLRWGPGNGGPFCLGGHHAGQCFRPGAPPRRNAEAVCRHYLSNGRRQGRYWLVGDVHNTPGRSLYVRLHGPIAARAQPANGPTPPPASMAICST